MFRSIWKKSFQSICSISFYSKSGIKIDTITGFKVNNDFLITDDYILNIKKTSKVKIKFVGKDGITPTCEMEFSYDQLKEHIMYNVGEKELSFAALKLHDETFLKLPSLKFQSNPDLIIGHPIATLGYQLDQDNLSLKSGILSSKYVDQEGNDHFQIDCTLNQGNSGSPVIDTETNEVVGIIGHKLTAATQSYKRIKQIINNNLSILKKSQGKAEIHDIDPIQVLIANQNQIKYILNEFYRSINTHTGLALNTKYIQEFFDNIQDVEDSISINKNFKNS